MAPAIMGDPAMLNLAFLIGHPEGTGAKCNGITIRCAHEQRPVPPELKENVAVAIAFPTTPLTSSRWSAQFVGSPPCPGTTTSEHLCAGSQPSWVFSCEVWMSNGT